jgi:alanyl-tRNA synthetase
VYGGVFGAYLCNFTIHCSCGNIYYSLGFIAIAETAKRDQSEKKSRLDPSVTGDAIRRRFLEFYAARNHKILPSSSLVPEDPTVLLTIAGMLQFKPIFLGQV